MKTTIDAKMIDTLRDLPDIIPVLQGYFDSWAIRVFDREVHACRNYLSPNRRDFYKALLITRGTGVFTLGLKTYYIERPTLLFIHPNDIISWRKLSPEAGGYYVLFKKSFISNHPLLSSVIDSFGLFADKHKSVINLEEDEVNIINRHFEQLKLEETQGLTFKEDAMAAYLQLLMVDSMRIGRFPQAESVSEPFGHIYQFFELLEKETTGINYTTPIRIKTAKEFAHNLSVHPNYLNELLKKHTGQNASTHIRNRILQEVKVLLLHTDWSFQEISYSIGFSEQANFNMFFKKNTGVTPTEFRKSRRA